MNLIGNLIRLRTGLCRRPWPGDGGGVGGQGSRIAALSPILSRSWSSPPMENLPSTDDAVCLKGLARPPQPGETIIPPVPAASSVELAMISVVPGQFGLLLPLQPEVFQEVRIDFAGSPGRRLRQLRCAMVQVSRLRRRAAGGRVLPEPAVRQDVADDVALPVSPRKTPSGSSDDTNSPFRTSFGG